MPFLLLAAIALVFVSRGKLSSAGSSSAGASSNATVVNTAVSGFQEQIAAGASIAIPQEINQQHQLATTFAPLAGAATTAAALALTATLSATAATGIGAVVAGVVILIDSLRTYVHLTANDFVKRFQNPFRVSLGNLIDPHDARMAAGTETLAGASDTYRAIEFLWEQFQDAADAYARQGHDADIVVKQAKQTLNGPAGLGPQFPNGFINFMLTKLQGEINQLATGNPLSISTGVA